jgi:hypothetical protein
VAPEIIRLKNEQANLVYALKNAELSDELRAQLETQLFSVHGELVLIAGGISVMRNAP